MTSCPSPPGRSIPKDKPRTKLAVLGENRRRCELPAHRSRPVDDRRSADVPARTFRHHHPTSDPNEDVKPGRKIRHHTRCTFGAGTAGPDFMRNRLYTSQLHC